MRCSRFVAVCLLVLGGLFVTSLWAQDQDYGQGGSYGHPFGPDLRGPLGVYAHLDIETAINNYPGSGTPTVEELRSYLRKLYATLLADPAISGITLGAHWDHIEAHRSFFIV